MRGFLQFAAFLAIVFFVVGEFFGGWFLGIPPHTPILAYKKTHTAEYTRRTTVADRFEFRFDGEVRRGTLVIEGTYQRPDSFQTGRQGTAERVVFRQEFRQGQRVDLLHTMREGQGIYRVRLHLDDGTGLFRLHLPEAGTL
jgi:hypothetical protein